MELEKELKIISLFTGAGGLDIGFEQAGFKIAVAVESDPSCCETLLANRPNLNLINKPIQKITSEEILKKGNLHILEPALVIGGPPCQPFSLAGNRKGLKDDRGELLFEFVRIVKETLPGGFVLENVKGLLNWNNGQALNTLINMLEEPIVYHNEEYKYEITKPVKTLNAVNYGVPQVRERLFLVGNRFNRTFSYPKPTVKIPKTVEDAISSLPPAKLPSETAYRVAGSVAKRRERYGY